MSRSEAGNVLARFNNFASNVAAQDVRKIDAGEALANPYIEMVHGAGLDTHQHLISMGLWIRDVFVAKNFGTAEFVNANRFHLESLALEA